MTQMNIPRNISLPRNGYLRDPGGIHDGNVREIEGGMGPPRVSGGGVNGPGGDAGPPRHGRGGLDVGWTGRRRSSRSRRPRNPGWRTDG